MQLEDAVVKLFESMVKGDNIPINMTIPQEPQTLTEYVEGWRLKIWDQGFLSILRGANPFKKNDNFGSFEGSKEVARRVVFR